MTQISIIPTAVPEPETYAMFLDGLGVMVLWFGCIWSILRSMWTKSARADPAEPQKPISPREVIEGSIEALIIG